MPEDPELVVPLKNLRLPLTPAVPAFVVATETEPVLRAVLVPVDMLSVPPVLDAAAPPLKDTAPPTPEVACEPAPPVTVTAPATEEAALVSPATSETEPPEVVDVPTFISTEPLAPPVDSPVDKVTPPEWPAPADKLEILM